MSHDHGCGRVTIVQTIATPTFSSEVIPSRPAGFDVRVTLSVSSSLYLPPGVQAHFPVAGPTVYPDDPNAGALANGCAQDPSGPQTPLEWHALPYVDVNSGSFAVSAGPQWHGATVSPAFRVVIPGDSGFALWAPRCTAARQTVHFDRTLYLLGRADSGMVTMAGFSRTRTAFGGVPVPFSLMELRINGQVAFSTTNPAGGSGQLTGAGLHAIHYGPNQFEVVVTKRATGPCNAKHSVQYAVEFAFNGSFHADTSGSSGAASGSGGCLPFECSGSTTVPFTLSNKGPATILEPELVMNWTFIDPDTVAAPYFSADAGASCATTVIDSRHYQVICEGAPFAAGATATVHVTFSYSIPRPQSGVVHEIWTDAWSFPGAYGGTSASGTGTVTTCKPPGPVCSPPAS